MDSEFVARHFPGERGIALAAPVVGKPTTSVPVGAFELDTGGGAKQ
jgi:hypothetical protein